MVLRMMLLMTRVHREGDQVGTKFKCCKEDVTSERYLGTVQVFRFYIRCSRYSSEIIVRTNPANGPYAIESGTTRPSYKAWPSSAVAARQEECGDDDDAMRALNDHCRDTRREMGMDH
uniref:Uncharacterized protein n=1 Tax=Oryza punctata TaxID=4537 RepID=A0A0E0LBB3_ORYPU